MHWSFFIIAALTLASAVAAISMRNIVHCALLLTVTFAGLAMFYLQLNAQFIGFAQVLVYIGAVAILIVFAILLTRSSDVPATERSAFSLGSGMIIALALFATLAKAIYDAVKLRRLGDPIGSLSLTLPPPNVTVQQIGKELMGQYALPLEILGLLLTAALIGAAVIALQDKRRSP